MPTANIKPGTPYPKDRKEFKTYSKLVPLSLIEKVIKNAKKQQNKAVVKERKIVLKSVCQKEEA